MPLAPSCFLTPQAVDEGLSSRFLAFNCACGPGIRPAEASGRQITTMRPRVEIGQMGYAAIGTGKGN